MMFDAILFDCDGVLVDSEPITNGVLCQMLNEAGWPLPPEECMRLFIGKTVRSETARIEARTGRPLLELAAADADIARTVPRRELAACFDLKRHFRDVKRTFRAVGLPLA